MLENNDIYVYTNINKCKNQTITFNLKTFS